MEVHGHRFCNYNKHLILELTKYLRQKQFNYNLNAQLGCCSKIIILMQTKLCLVYWAVTPSLLSFCFIPWGLLWNCITIIQSYFLVILMTDISTFLNLVPKNSRYADFDQMHYRKKYDKYTSFSTSLYARRVFLHPPCTIILNFSTMVQLTLSFLDLQVYMKI